MHLFMMSDLELDCRGSIATATTPSSSPMYNLMGPFGTTWPAVVDTGTSCLTLPAEMFDILSSWWEVNYFQEITQISHRTNIVCSDR